MLDLQKLLIFVRCEDETRASDAFPGFHAMDTNRAYQSSLKNKQQIGEKQQQVDSTEENIGATAGKCHRA